MACLLSCFRPEQTNYIFTDIRRHSQRWWYFLKKSSLHLSLVDVPHIVCIYICFQLEQFWITTTSTTGCAATLWLCSYIYLLALCSLYKVCIITVGKPHLLLKRLLPRTLFFFSKTNFHVWLWHWQQHHVYTNKPARFVFALTCL